MDFWHEFLKVYCELPVKQVVLFFDGYLSGFQPKDNKRQSAFMQSVALKHRIVCDLKVDLR
jgi:hypothetical protein